MLTKFKDSDLFKGIDADYLENLEAVCKEINVARNDYLFRQGDAGKGMYIIIDGEIGILVKDDKGKDQEIATLTSGSPFGEISLLEKQTRIASAKAKKKTSLLYLDIKQFSQQIKQGNVNALRISHNIALTMIERLEKANELLTQLQNHANSVKAQREVSLYKEKLLEEGLF